MSPLALRKGLQRSKLALRETLETGIQGKDASVDAALACLFEYSIRYPRSLPRFNTSFSIVVCSRGVRQC